MTYVNQSHVNRPNTNEFDRSGERKLSNYKDHSWSFLLEGQNHSPFEQYTQQDREP